MSAVLASNRPSANTPPRSGLPVVASNIPSANTPPGIVQIKTPPPLATRTEHRKSMLPVPTAIPRQTYADAVLVEDVNEVK